MIVQAIHPREELAMLIERKEMTDQVIHLHLVINRIRMTTLQADHKVMIGQTIHQEMNRHHTMHHPGKVLHHLEAAHLVAAAVDILQVEVAPVILLVAPVILPEVQDQVHLQEAGDNSDNMI